MTTEAALLLFEKSISLPLRSPRTGGELNTYSKLINQANSFIAYPSGLRIGLSVSTSQTTNYIVADDFR